MFTTPVQFATSWLPYLLIAQLQKSDLGLPSPFACPNAYRSLSLKWGSRWPWQFYGVAAPPPTCPGQPYLPVSLPTPADNPPHLPCICPPPCPTTCFQDPSALWWRNCLLVSGFGSVVSGIFIVMLQRNSDTNARRPLLGYCSGRLWPKQCGQPAPGLYSSDLRHRLPSAQRLLTAKHTRASAPPLGTSVMENVRLNLQYQFKITAGSYGVLNLNFIGHSRSIY